MKLKFALVALALTVLPVTAFAQCSGHEQQVQSCAEGTKWDDASKSCVKQITS